MFNCVPAGHKATETVPKKNEFLQANFLSPFLNVAYKLMLTVCSVYVWIMRGEVDSSASSKSWEVDGIEFSVGVKVVKVLVELWNATAKAMNHDKRKIIN